jgi:hypothetical protein
MKPGVTAALTVLLALPLALAGCSDDPEADPTGSTSPAATSAAASVPASSGPAAPMPEPPDGTRWQGTNGVVVAVPEAWVTATEVCGPREPLSVRYLDRDSLAVRCPQIGGRTQSVLLVASDRRTGRFLGTGLSEHAEIRGLGVRFSPTRCRLGPTGPCTLAFAVPSARATFEVSYRGSHPTRFVERLRDSLRRVAPGYVTVPAISFGRSSEAAVKRLEAAGLVAEVPDVDFPYYVTGTDPAAGTPVPAGSTVGLEIGDG